MQDAEFFNLRVSGSCVFRYEQWSWPYDAHFYTFLTYMALIGINLELNYDTTIINKIKIKMYFMANLDGYILFYLFTYILHQ